MRSWEEFKFLFLFSKKMTFDLTVIAESTDVALFAMLVNVTKAREETRRD